MRTFGILPTEFWKNEKLQSLPATTRLIAAYLYSGPHNNMIGCFRLPLTYIAEDLKLQMRFVSKAIKELTAISFLRFDEASKYFVITNFITARAKKWLLNQNNYIAATRVLEEISDSVPYKEEIRLQLIEIKRPDSNDDTNNVLTTSDQRTNKGEGEGEGKGEGEGEEEGEGEAHSAPASPPRSFSDSFIPFPKSFAFPLKNGSVLTLEPETIDFWQARFPNIVVPARLHKHREWFLNNPHRRMNQKGTETALLKFLDQDNDEAIRNRSP